jgi:putative Ca2+/H+ antiporter (TMEM165/GDT1 family)
MHRSILIGLLITLVLAGPLPPPSSEPTIVYHASAPHHPLSSIHLPEFTPSQSSAFFLSLLMILFSEIGDKTFFIAAILAARSSPRVVYTGAAAALVVMSVLSALLGSYIAPSVANKQWITLAAACLFLFYGIKNLRDALDMPADAVEEEMREVEYEILQEYKEEKDEFQLLSSAWGSRQQSWASWFKGIKNLVGMLTSPCWVQAFVMVFLAEWGDRSQIATIALAASEDMYFVTLGTVVGHLLCTGLAVIGGRLLAQRLSMRNVTLGGAVLFVLFSFIYFYQGLVLE